MIETLRFYNVRLIIFKNKLTDLNDLKEMFRLPKPENKDRKYFEVDETE